MASAPPVVPEPVVTEPAVPEPTGPSTEDLQAQLDRTREEIDRLKAAPVAPAAPAQPGQPMTREELEKRFWQDPLGFSRAIAQQAVAEDRKAQGSGTVETLRSLAREKVRGTDEVTQQFFDKHEAEVEELVRTVPNNDQANVQVWINAFNVIKGRHVQELVGSMHPSKPPDGPSPSSPSMPAPPKVTPLSEDERQVAKGMGISEEDYRVGKETYADQDRSWPTVLTFSSEDARRAAKAAAAKK